MVLGDDLGFFANLPSADNKAMLIWACGSNDKYRVPRLLMPKPEFLEWVANLYIANGRKLDAFDFNDPHSTLNWKIGWFGFTPCGDEESDPDEVIMTV
eukprot:7431424-Lingulodinium_polyedra.AAC.1